MYQELFMDIKILFKAFKISNMPIENTQYLTITLYKLNTEVTYKSGTVI